MPQRFCPNCGVRVDDETARFCPQCGRTLPPTPPESAPEPDRPQRPPTGREAPAEQPSAERAPHRPTESREAGGVVRRCPHCGEALYPDERVCWACGRPVDVPEAPEPAEGPRPEAPGPGEPGGVPQRGGPAAEGPPAEAAQPARPAAPEVPDEVMALAWWSLGLGLAGVFTCGALGLLGVVAIWLGIRALNRGAGWVAVVGIVFGALGTLMFIGWAIALVAMLPGLLRSGTTHVLAPLYQKGALLCAMFA